MFWSKYVLSTPACLVHRDTAAIHGRLNCILLRDYSCNGGNVSYNTVWVDLTGTFGISIQATIHLFHTWAVADPGVIPLRAQGLQKRPPAL